MKTDQEKINSIMERFNFAKVHDVMVETDWRWAWGMGQLNEGLRVPTIEEIRFHARRMLVEACEENQYQMECGGFRVVRDRKEGLIELSFVAAECSEWDEEDGPPSKAHKTFFNPIEDLEV